MAYEQILVDIKSGVATITLNRPEKLNAYTAQMGAEIHWAFAELDENDDARVVVVTGAGRAFCAGADLSARGGGTFDRRDQPNAANAANAAAREPRTIRPWNMKKPIIAAINGPAVGVGITLPMQWDIRVAAESARIGFVFVRRGVLPEALSTWLLPRLIGVAKTNELLMSGRIINAKEALEFGIVSHVWPDADFRQKVSELASDIADNTAPVSVAMTKRLIYGLLGELSPEKAQAIDHKAFTWAGQQADSREGVSSFLEKRRPAWKMTASKDFPDFLPPVK
ncbi:MAG TPA: enoyl-CoA hydratase-related protein [Candidatus Binataceae bacterium]|nr:enoyl-CoA hydratase-related protein [Candidatus Binataceae bacterium]